ncbi:MAG: Dabb family protein [Devosia sp.]
MIRHCVFVKFDLDFGRAQRDTIYSGLDALRAKIPGMRRVHAGENVSPEGLGKGFDECFFVDFDNAAVRDAYLVHPDHQALGGRLVAAAQGGTAGIIVFDFDLPA